MASQPFPSSSEADCHRLLLAALPPEFAVRRLAACRGALPVKARAVRDDRLHMSLFVTDDHTTPPTGLADRIAETVSEVRQAPVEVTFDHVLSVRGSTAIRPSAAQPGLALLERQISRALRLAGVLPRQGRRFSPHVTLIYGEGQTFDQRVQPIRWTIDELVLIHSLVGLTEHRVLGRWRLG